MTSPSQPWPWMVAHANDYVPPIRLSSIVGDCIHNMRAALDNLVCGLALTLDPACNCKDTKFPFTENESDWTANSPIRLRGVPPEAVNILRALQPWCDFLKPNPLLMVNKLGNMDKHRFCAFTLGYSRSTLFSVHCTDGTVVQISPNESLHLGDVHTFTLPIDRFRVAN